MLEIAIDADEEWDSSHEGLVSWEQLARGAAEAAIAESAFPQLATGDRPVEISIRLTGDEEVRALNSRWRGKDQSTNVLSFPLIDQSNFHQATISDLELLLGDVVLARGVCESEAADKRVPIEDHAVHLLVHGTLHLLGYDHHDDAHAEDMEAREIRALERLGIANPYEVAA